ncbi:glycosyltransferase family 2 protein [Paraconexibacter sp.]|uniref:glycosyltransferase family 2 protein n=1 Tax=Paraconexibacter sp. TaxID=2949640 RepID=UPI00356904D0
MTAPIDLSFCVVNTNQRELLLRGLDAIAREREALGDAVATEVILLDNASQDGSADAAAAHPTVDELIRLERREGVSANVNAVVARSRAPLCLLLNEDAELQPGATRALLDALDADPRAGAAAAALLRPEGWQQPSAWRFPSVWTALAGALFLHRLTTVQSKGAATRRVDWAQSCTMLVRREAVEEAGWWDPDFFVYSDEVDVQKRMAQHGWHTLYVPSARSVHHEQLSTDSVPERRIVELSRNRDKYLRKHHGAGVAWLVRWLTAFPYAVRTVAALVLPGHDPRRYATHVRATLRPGRGEGIREAAEAFNRRLDAGG